MRNQNINKQQNEHFKNIITSEQLSSFPSYIKILEYTE
ncbi:Methyl-accepting chemotaxis protein [Borrelia duttonii CR2A]|uniref:Methyl-accepting chemotaxis protein n=1 Tax=Borrelia duttonii CR2A TaxID=1432657 RepID=W6TIY6_9SPIR|nr:Methyl-accepting chemotaxis protein [Borrelia duttonii CR2A]